MNWNPCLIGIALAWSSLPSLAQYVPHADQAMSEGLWEVAALRYERSLSTQNDSQSVAQRQNVAIKLIECQIRLKQANQVLPLIEQAWLQSAPNFAFWKGSVLAQLGKWSAAEAAFLNHLNQNPSALLEETLLNLTALSLNRGRAEDADSYLARLELSADSERVCEARLRRASLAIEREDWATARKMIQASRAAKTQRVKSYCTLLQGRLLLKEGNAQESAKLFSEALKASDLPPEHLKEATLGLADSLVATGSHDEAIEVILSWLQKSSATDGVDVMFQRLITWSANEMNVEHPLMKRFEEWSNPTAGSAKMPDANRAAFSLYAQIILKLKINSPQALASAQHDMNRLRWEFPFHPVTPQVLLSLSDWAKEQGNILQAARYLDSMPMSRDQKMERPEVTFKKAEIAYASGNFTLAEVYFKQASPHLEAANAQSAKINSSLSKYRYSKRIDTVLVNAQPDPDVRDEMEAERLLSLTDRAEQIEAIAAFLKDKPGHPKALLLSLARIEAQLQQDGADLNQLNEELKQISSSTTISTDALLRARIAFAQLKLAEKQQRHDDAIAQAELILEQFPKDPIIVESAFILARLQDAKGNHHKVRLCMEKLAASGLASTQTQAAWLLAARSAALVGTPQSREEALVLYQKAMQSQGDLIGVATLEKARLLMDLSRFPEATLLLKQLSPDLTKAGALAAPVGLLLGESLYAKGAKEVASLKEALTVYNELWSNSSTPPIYKNRIQYMRGLIFESLPQTKNVNAKQDTEALEVYYSVLELASGTAPAEWEYFERCGFRALSLLAKAERWDACITLAEKIASFNGPRAEEARNQAKTIRLKHMIWDK